MGTFAADIAELKSLGGVLHGLADEAGRLSVGPSAGAPPATGGTFAPMATGPLLGNSSFSPANTVLTSFLEASAISHELVEGLLVPSLRERLGETGDIMTNVAEKFRSRDEQSAAELATTYTDATGAWVAQEPTA